ncbi:MAG: hypothetical protein AAB649_04035, partial [Patescibacteria group bacterium]
GAGLLLAANRDFQFETVQGLSNPLYAALIMAAAYVFVCNKRYLVSVYAALATLTRYEGAAVAGILIPSLWFTHRSKLFTFVREAIPFLILVSIPLVLTPLTGNIGVRTFSDIASDEGLYVAHTWDYFLPSLKAFKIFFGRLWILSPSVGSVFAAFGYGALAGFFAVFLYKKFPKLRYVGLLVPLIICYILFYKTLFGEEAKVFIALFTALTGFGVSAACILRPKVCIPIVFMVLVQTAVITAILPKNRYYLQIIPFIAMGIAGGLYVASGGKKALKITYICLVFVLCMMISLVFRGAEVPLSGQISDYNEKSAGQTVMVQAGRYLKNVSGNVALYNESDLALRVYVVQNRMVPFLDSLQDLDEQYEKVQQLKVQYILESSEHPYFYVLIEKYPEKFQEVATFQTRWADVSATLYRVY